MEELSVLYFVILPFVMAAAVVEGLWLSRTQHRAAFVTLQAQYSLLVRDLELDPPR